MRSLRMKNIEYNQNAILELETVIKEEKNISTYKRISEVIINNTPDEVGFDSRKNWTIELARQWVISNFNINISHNGMYIHFNKNTANSILNNTVFVEYYIKFSSHSSQKIRNV